MLPIIEVADALSILITSILYRCCAVRSDVTEIIYISSLTRSLHESKVCDNDSQRSFHTSVRSNIGYKKMYTLRKNLVNKNRRNMRLNLFFGWNK